MASDFISFAKTPNLWKFAILIFTVFTESFFYFCFFPASHVFFLTNILLCNYLERGFL